MYCFAPFLSLGPLCSPYLPRAPLRFWFFLPGGVSCASLPFSCFLFFPLLVFIFLWCSQLALLVPGTPALLGAPAPTGLVFRCHSVPLHICCLCSVFFPTSPTFPSSPFSHLSCSSEPVLAPFLSCLLFPLPFSVPQVVFRPSAPRQLFVVCGLVGGCGPSRACGRALPPFFPCLRSISSRWRFCFLTCYSSTCGLPSSLVLIPPLSLFAPLPSTSFRTYPFPRFLLCLWWSFFFHVALLTL